MRKKFKKRPEPPKWFGYDTDNCWCCKNKHNCNSCKRLKQFRKQEDCKKQKDIDDKNDI